MTSPAIPREPVGAAFTRRAARADHLAGSSASASVPLRFAAGLYRAQGCVAVEVVAAHGRRPLGGQLENDLEDFAFALQDLLRYAAAAGPSLLAAEAQARGEEPPARARARLLAYWGGEGEARLDYLSRALLRPYAEALAGLGVPPRRPLASGGCPFCGGSPWIAARRAGVELDGARRFLGCALCGGEWAINRICCPGCGEEDPARLPAFSSDAHPSVRIEACETCRRYLKSIDLTADARPIPEVDDLASLALDLWATEQGFARMEPGLAGL